jgi:phage gp29-like protein
MVMSINSLIERLWPGGDEAIDEKQTDNEARIGMIKREFAEHPSKGLTPARLYRILEDAEKGDLKAQHELFEDMEEKDAQIAADLGKRRQLAAELEWQIVPPDNASAQEKKAAEFCAEVFVGLEVEDLIIDLGSGIGHGWANLELPWVMDGGKRIIEQPLFRPHSWFKLHPERQDELRLRDLSGDGAELWPLGWAQHRHRAKAGYIARSGLHRVLVWPYLFQNYALADLAELLEIYGLPARVGTYPRNATAKEKATLLRAVTNLGHRAAGIIPEGMQIDFKEAADGKGELFEVMIRWCERAKAKAILGNTLTSGTGEGTNTNALGNVHERSQQSLIRSDARQYAGTVNRDILWPMAAMNFGIDDRRRAPRFYLDTGETEDFKLLAESLPKFVDMGARIPVWWLHEKTRIPQAGDKDEVLQPTNRTPSTSQETELKRVAALKGGSVMPGEGDVVDAQIARLGADSAPAIDQMVAVVRTLLDEAESLEQFRDRLIEAYPDMDTDALAEVMTQALTAAKLAGRYDILEEVGLGD